MPILTFTVNSKNMRDYMVVGKNGKFHPCKFIRTEKALLDRHHNSPVSVVRRKLVQA